MSTAIAALKFVILVTIITTANSVSSSRCITCACGSSGQNYTHCLNDSSDEQVGCDRWVNCQTCVANTTFCLSCPPDRSSPTCSEACGRIPQRTRPPRIPGSKGLLAGDWPWTMGIATVSSEDVENHMCGGVILDKKTVLTAAQCVVGAQNLILLFGTVYPTPTGDSGAEQKRKISQIILHPHFDNETKANDLAILKFEPELNYSEAIQPICLPNLNSSAGNLLPGQKGLVAGWGFNYTMYMYIPAVRYEAANITVQPEERCLESCQKQGLSTCSTPKAFCADYPEGIDACMFLGTPMVIYHEEMQRFTVEGLVTRSHTGQHRNCRRGEIDTILTNVSHYMPFILRNLS